MKRFRLSAEQCRLGSFFPRICFPFGRLSAAHSVHSKLGHVTSFIRKRVATKKMKSPRFLLTVMLLGQALAWSAGLQAAEKTLWKPVAFAIVKFNGEAPKSWNMYHSEKKGLLLVHLWKRYLLLDIKEQEVYELDPQTVKPHGEDVEWSNSDAPDQPLEISEWKERNVGRLLRVSFRLGKDGHILELQIPLKPDGKPAY